MAKIDRVQEVSIDLLKPYENNAKVHTEEQINKIAESIEAFGFLSPCLIDNNYNIIAGHGRVLASKQLNLEKVPCVFIEGLTETQRKAYILADNRLTEMGEWDYDLLSDELANLKENDFDIDLTGFNIDDIVFTDEEDYYVEDEAEEQENEKPRVKQGEVWILGRHKLMCGDSTKFEDVEKLCGGVSRPT